MENSNPQGLGCPTCEPGHEGDECSDHYQMRMLTEARKEGFRAGLERAAEIHEVNHVSQGIQMHPPCGCLKALRAEMDKRSDKEARAR